MHKIDNKEKFIHKSVVKFLHYYRYFFGDKIFSLFYFTNYSSLSDSKEINSQKNQSSINFYEKTKHIKRFYNTFKLF
jgi:hypothetical protein